MRGKRILTAALAAVFLFITGCAGVSHIKTDETSEINETGDDNSMWEKALHDCLRELDGGTWSTADGAGHLQGICCDDELNYMYFTFTDRLIKVDMRTGEIVGSVTGLSAGGIYGGGAHLGCLAYHDGKVYASLEYKVQERFYIAVFDCAKITGMDINYKDAGVMYGMHLPEVDADYRDDLNAGEHENAEGSLGHRYGTSGIDGITFGTLPGEGPDSKTYLFLAYGIYGNAARFDNNNMVLLAFDPDQFDPFLLPFEESRTETDGLLSELRLFAYIGNNKYGIQNLEYDKSTGDLWFMCYGRPEGSAFPALTMFVADGSVPLYTAEIEVGQSVPAESGSYAAAQSRADCYRDSQGNMPTGTFLTLRCLSGGECGTAVYGDTGFPARICGAKAVPANADTGFISLGGDYYYIASQGSRTESGVTCRWGTAALYKLDRSDYSFTRVK